MYICFHMQFLLFRKSLRCLVDFQDEILFLEGPIPQRKMNFLQITHTIFKIQTMKHGIKRQHLKTKMHTGTKRYEYVLQSFLHGYGE